MKSVLATATIACSILAFSLAVAQPCKAVTTSISRSLVGPAPYVLEVDYYVTLESNSSWLNEVHIYAQNSNTTYEALYSGNMNFQGPFTDKKFALNVNPINPGMYDCGGDCKGHTLQGAWYAGSSQLTVTVPN